MASRSFSKISSTSYSRREKNITSQKRSKTNKRTQNRSLRSLSVTITRWRYRFMAIMWQSILIGYSGWIKLSMSWLRSARSTWVSSVLPNRQRSHRWRKSCRVKFRRFVRRGSLTISTAPIRIWSNILKLVRWGNLFHLFGTLIHQAMTNLLQEIRRKFRMLFYPINQAPSRSHQPSPNPYKRIVWQFHRVFHQPRWYLWNIGLHWS